MSVLPGLNPDLREELAQYFDRRVRCFDRQLRPHLNPQSRSLKTTAPLQLHERPLLYAHAALQAGSLDRQGAENFFSTRIFIILTL
jgi:hypothetical protein